MKPIICVCVIALTLAGCMVGPDQTPYTMYRFWDESDLVIETPEQLRETGEEYPLLLRTPGDDTVFAVRRGMTRGRFTTAHSSHEEVVMKISGTPQMGRSYRCAPEDGTLYFDGFKGYSSMYLDDSEPAHAELTIIRVDQDQIRARAEISLVSMHASRHAPVEEWRRYAIEFDEEVRFTRGKAGELGAWNIDPTRDILRSMAQPGNGDGQEE